MCAALQAVLLPNAIFIAYLLYNLRRNVETLTRHRSHIMSTYYGLVWAVCICNCLRSVVQLIGCAAPQHHARHYTTLHALARLLVLHAKPT